MNKDFQETMKFRLEKEPSITPKEIFEKVYLALKEKGYDPINQLVGYFISEIQHTLPAIIMPGR